MLIFTLINGRATGSPPGAGRAREKHLEITLKRSMGTSRDSHSVLTSDAPNAESRNLGTTFRGAAGVVLAMRFASRNTSPTTATTSTPLGEQHEPKTRKRTASEIAYDTSATRASGRAQGSSTSTVLTLTSLMCCLLRKVEYVQSAVVLRLQSIIEPKSRDGCMSTIVTRRAPFAGCSAMDATKGLDVFPMTLVDSKPQLNTCHNNDTVIPAYAAA